MTYSKTFTRIFIILFLCIVSSCNIEPFEGEIPEGSNPAPDNCGEALEDSGDASAAFSSVTPSDSDYSELCTAYKNALKNQIVLCGDEGGLIQIIIDGIGDCGDSGSGGSVADGHAFMTADINGVAYNDLKPNSYLLFKEAIGFNGFLSRSDDNYIEIQGNSTYSTPTLIEAETKEINIFIPSVDWKEGTFVLYDDLNDIEEGVSYFTYLTFDRPSNINQVNEPGEMIITKFDLVEREIQGTFNFEYRLINTTDNTEEGPFKLTGTFDYSLDDEFFD